MLNNLYNIKIIEKKKILCSQECDATEFIAVDFCTNDDAKRLVTLTNVTNGINFTVIIWNYEKQKCIAFQELSQTVPGFVLRNISFAPSDHNTVLVTGKDVYYFLKVAEAGTVKTVF